MRLWAVPIVVTLAVLSVLAALDLDGVLKPTTDLRHFPFAIMNEDTGPPGKQLVNGLLSGLDKDTFEVRVLSGEPRWPRRVERARIVILTNPRAGTLGCAIAGQTLSHAMNVLNHRLGERLSKDAAAQANAASTSGAVTLLLANPVVIENQVYKPLPGGTGNGLSAIYYSLLLVPAGFTGSIVVTTLVDSMPGHVPAEFGPVCRFAAQVRISRLRTLFFNCALSARAADVRGPHRDSRRARNAHSPGHAVVRCLGDRRGFSGD